MPMIAHIWGLDLVHEGLSFLRHSLFLAALVGLGGGGFLGWIAARKNYKKLSFRKWVVFEGISFQENGDRVEVDFRSFGDVRELHELIRHPSLEARISDATKSAVDGFMRAKDPCDHRLMMSRFEDWLSGNDWVANMAALKGRPINRDTVAFCPTFFREDNDGAMIRVLVLDDTRLVQLQDAAFCARLVIVKPEYQGRLPLLRRMGQEDLSLTQQSRDTAVVWRTTIETAAN
jgi:hypothetical protein